jgi:hypothetical protein
VKENPVHFLLLIYDDPTIRKEMGPDDWKALAQADVAFRGMIPEKGAHLLASQVLEPPNEAITLRFDKGEVTRGDGPAVDTREWFAGCYLIECADAEIAVDIAHQVPMPDGCGRVEVRPVMPGQAHIARPADTGSPTSV